jgi:hypothetical protein
VTHRQDELRNKFMNCSEYQESQSDETAPNGTAWSSLAVTGHSGRGKDVRDGSAEKPCWKTINEFERRGTGGAERTVGKRERRRAPAREHGRVRVRYGGMRWRGVERVGVVWRPGRDAGVG